MNEPTYRYTDEYLFERMDASWQSKRRKSRRIAIVMPDTAVSDDSLATPIESVIESAIDAVPCRTHQARTGAARRLRGVCLPRTQPVIDHARDRIFFRDPR